MDQVKTGRFIAELRRQQGWTQEALGEKLGVTNKTVSRWENGNYMPDIEMLQLLSQTFQVSMEELLAGRRLPDEAVQEDAGTAWKASPFSLEEQRVYWKKKWRREHRGLLVFLFVLVAGTTVVLLVVRRAWLVGLAPLVALVAYGYQNNSMMRYVEKQLFGPENEKTKNGAWIR